MEDNIEKWKIKKLIKSLSAAQGNGTSMVSLIIPPREQIPKFSKMLTEEYGTAGNIKSRVNRQAVQSAILSAQQRLKLYNRVPDNGLIIYSGTILTEDGKEKKVNIDFEPFKPINTSLYLCDNRFHTEALLELTNNEEKYGFIIIDGHSCLFATLCGNTREILGHYDVELPNKQGRGGQSALRFARLRIEKRNNYVRKVTEMAQSFFLRDNMVNFNAIILAGLADFKKDLYDSELLDARIKAKINPTLIDIAHGKEKGLNQAIDLAGDILANVKFVKEKKLLSTFFTAIASDNLPYCYGIKDTLTALTMGAVETLIIWEELTLLVSETDLPADNCQDEKTSLLDYLAENYTKFGAKLELVTDKSEEGAQFKKAFQGIGGLLRYKIELTPISDLNLEDDTEDTEDYF